MVAVTKSFGLKLPAANVNKDGKISSHKLQNNLNLTGLDFTSRKIDVIFAVAELEDLTRMMMATLTMQILNQCLLKLDDIYGDKKINHHSIIIIINKSYFPQRP